MYHIVNLVFQPPFPPFHSYLIPRTPSRFVPPTLSLLLQSTSFRRFAGIELEPKLRYRCSQDDEGPRSKRFRRGWIGWDARARTPPATLATMAQRTDSGPVRANLADQTGAKSRAFVRVNSIHELSILRTSPSLSAPLRRHPL